MAASIDRARKVKVGVIGTGVIFAQYVKGCRAFEIIDLVACADLDQDKAHAAASQHSIPRVCTPDALLADPEIEIVVNLTVPHAHAQVNLAAIEAGKHVYSEKPLAVTREDGKKTLVAAREKGVLLGCAPDTLLGGGLQTCRKLIDDGAIGQPVAAVALFASRGPEAWHPNPDFFYQAGGGPLFDLGPYYLSGLIYLLGPVRRVTSSARISFPERIAASESNRGRRIPVDIPTHVTGTLDFASGPVGTLITSFDVWGHHLPRLEIYGSEGSLSVPDPNIFGGAVKLLRAGQKEWEDIPLTHSAEVGRGIGVADLAHALRYGRPHRASGELGYHVLDVMHTFGEASAAGKHILVESTCALPAPLPVGLPQGHLDAAPA